ncbi:MAG: ubiquinone/menaquinone biosynthesis methyltransferase [Dehalococcoidia bacterium]|nr:ubiquinone/menaquinone biosynthesis methyltransferase [Dehalococcoidia bacterium]MDP7239807.1 ubiquinone/menaquinone biosynthesis methyltransferase [Dehalococcoidia bacterium]
MAEMFRHLAPSYDRINRVISLGGDLRWRRWAADEAMRSKPGLVLDLATGTGKMAKAVQLRGGKVVAVDLSPGMLDIARKKECGATTLLLGHVLKLPFQDNSFDALTIAFALRDFPGLAGPFRECYRVLRPGGKLVCLELSRPRRWAALLHHLYMKRAVPTIGWWLGGRAKDYRFLPHSVAHFPAAPELARLLESAGFRQVHFRRLAAGAVAIHCGCKENG